jgi:hypothetical protein
VHIFFALCLTGSLRKLPLQVDISKVEFSASFLSLKTAGGSPPSASWGRSSL